MRLRSATICALTVIATGCKIASALSPIPDTRTLVDRAHELEPKCKGTQEDAPLATMSSAAGIDSVEPAYSYTQGGPNGRDAHLRGARIHLRPAPGVTRELIARTLECHEARVVLGAVAPRADDPYALPNGWVAIDVESEKDGFAAVVTTDDLDVAKDVVERAHLAAKKERPALMPPP